MNRLPTCCEIRRAHQWIARKECRDLVTLSAEDRVTELLKALDIIMFINDGAHAIAADITRGRPSEK